MSRWEVAATATTNALVESVIGLAKTELTRQRLWRGIDDVEILVWYEPNIEVKGTSQRVTI